MLLKVSDIKQYLYCPRIIYFTYVLPVEKKTTTKMATGKEEHVTVARKEARRRLRLYGLEEAARYFNVWLRSERLQLEGVLDTYCPTGRDVYLRRVAKVKAPPNLAMVEGTILHAAVADVLVAAKKVIYSCGVGDYCRIVENIERHPLLDLGPWEAQLGPEERAAVKDRVELVTTFEKTRILARLQETLSRQPYIGEDSLVNLTVPVVVEQKLDGSFVGLSSYLSTDAYIFTEPMVLDLKFGERRDFHRLTTTGYGMVMESVWEFPVNLGCIVYVEFRNDRLLVTRDIHVISDELRQQFIDARDEKSRMVEEEIDPGVAGECYATCPYYSVCHQ
ncbi:MAG: type I-A CRISPR-associated protein Cas4/Csa1 [Clostridia bacterium]|nr:MAG: type I-A CRISPR-associated protein Cas4/Csa1 [Clostridia bacterium]